MSISARANLFVSIDLENNSLANGDYPAMETLTKQLLDAAAMLRLPVTWGIANPGNSMLARLIDGRAGQEIALIAEPEWASASVDRSLFAHELERRVETARRTGIAIRTLNLPSADLEGRLDILVRRRISVIRVDRPLPETTASMCVRYGVWEAPAFCRIPGEHPWWLGGNRAAARRANQQALDHDNAAHVVIDAPSLIERGRGAAAAIGVLRDAATLCQSGKSAAGTLGELSGRHRVLRIGTGRSILRAA